MQVKALKVFCDVVEQRSFSEAAADNRNPRSVIVPTRKSSTSPIRKAEEEVTPIEPTVITSVKPARSSSHLLQAKSNANRQNSK